ncbi:MAG: T9SS type A sorting domain-containing protein [Flavobacteriales bacterium]
MALLQKCIHVLLLVLCVHATHAQTVFWFEDFDNNPLSRWTIENAAGSGTNPTPAGIAGLVYGANAAVEHDRFIINDQNTPELSAPGIFIGALASQGSFVRGRHYACGPPNNLPNPFINTAPGPNKSLHITSYASCGGLIYGGTPGSDDWNCITFGGLDFPVTKTEQIAFLNVNINATGITGITLEADFFIGGDEEGVKAHSTILFSVNGGVTWQILADPILNPIFFLAGTCDFGWSHQSFALPASCNNQNDLRIAFRWVEDGDNNTDFNDYALGASFNVDNIMLSTFSALPAQLVSMNAAYTNEKVEIEWITASETNNDYFTLERLVDGLNFEKISQIKGAGNSNQANAYFFEDTEPLDGITYYRLKQTDFDGSTREVRTVSVNGRKTLIRVYPNPTNGIFSIEGAVNNANFIVTNAMGVVVLQAQLNSAISQLDMSAESKGIYFYSVISNGKVAGRGKLLVE